MIVMARIDDRLIHGQVAVIWSKDLNVDRIIVASDKIAANEIQANVLKGAAPSSVKAFVLSIEKAATILNDPRSENKRVMVVTDSPNNILQLLEKINEKPRLNIANYGRIGGTLSDKEKITETVYVTEEDKKTFNDIFNLGLDFEYQPLPNDKKKSLKELLKGAE
ncbi:PTS system sorbose subfamily transporter subunit IIB [Marinilactibacillus sp. 15R]|uniref:PTS system mannose/fructose/N-acetylgalactosamine-transporter subunit IIB n=1 Tax=Marinilactibacillus sp. 15R TaxID=1911586 RepID=UPI00090BFF90|nr:PTS sugar transporter subunit IIB [Marinilactibacillus sp. 15R]API88710.1 PTS system sorbose subfamily transporter subunit IIB [Marinilactibacillus sp. 15R]